MTSKDMYFNCACKKEIRFELGEPEFDVDSGYEGLKVTISHNKSFIYSAKIGGVDFVEQASVLKIAAILARNIVKAAEADQLEPGCIAMWGNGSWVLSTLLSEAE